MPNCDEIHRFSLVQSYRASHLLQYQYYTEIAPQYQVHVQTKLNNDVLSAFIQQFTSHNTVLG